MIPYVAEFSLDWASILGFQHIEVVWLFPLLAAFISPVLSTGSDLLPHSQ